MNNIIEEGIIKLERFCKDNIEHLSLAKDLKNDDGINEFFSEWEQITALSIKDDTNTFYSYVIKFNDKAVGICTITFNNDVTAVFSQGYLASERGKGYAGQIRSLMINYLASQGVVNIKGYIRKDNIKSLRSVLKTGITPVLVPGTNLMEIQYPINRKRS